MTVYVSPISNTYISSFYEKLTNISQTREAASAANAEVLAKIKSDPSLSDKEKLQQELDLRTNQVKQSNEAFSASMDQFVNEVEKAGLTGTQRALLLTAIDSSLSDVLQRARLNNEKIAQLQKQLGIDPPAVAQKKEEVQIEKDQASTQTAGDSQPANPGSDKTGTNVTGGQAAAEPLTPTEVAEVKNERTEIAELLADRKEPPVEVASSVNATDPKAAEQTVGSTKTIEFVPTNSNPLHRYATYTYGITLHLLPADSYNALARGEAWLPSAKTLISSAGRWGKDPNNTNKFTRPSQFADDFYFDGLTMSSVIGMNQQSRASNVIDINFNLIEPYGLTLLNRLVSLAAEMNVPNYVANPYVLQIDFFGNDEAGNIVNPLPDLTKFLPIKMIAMKIKVGAGGATYACTASPYNHSAFGQIIASTPANFEITAKTVENFFKNDADETALSAAVAKTQQRETILKATQAAVNNINNLNQIGEATSDMVQQQTIYSEKISELKKAITTTQYTVNSYSSAYNAFQQILVDKKNIQHPTKIKFNIDEDIAKSDIVYPKKNSTETSPMTKRSEGKAVSKAYSSNNPGGAGKRGASASSGPTFQSERFNINAGTSILDVINQVMRSSTYITNQIKDTTNPNDQGTPVNWFKIIPQIQLKEFDFIKNDYSFEVTFSIVKHAYYNTKHPLVSFATESELKKAVRKRYDYIYTGHNTDIIDFAIDFDAVYYNTVQALTGNLEKLSDAQDADTVSKKNDPAISQQQTGGVANNALAPITFSQAFTGMNSGQNRLVQRAADIMTSIYSSVQGDMMNLKMTIIGDPDFIKQDDIYFNPANLNYPVADEYKAPGGSLLTDRGDIISLVTFKTPVDIDPSTGGLRTDEKYLESSFSGFFKIIKVTSEFKSGKFTQSLEAVRLSPAKDKVTDVDQRIELNSNVEVVSNPLITTTTTPTFGTLINPYVNTGQDQQNKPINEKMDSYNVVTENRGAVTTVVVEPQTTKLEEVAATGETRDITDSQGSQSTAKDSVADNTAPAPAAPDPPPDPPKPKDPLLVTYEKAEEDRKAADAAWTAARSSVYNKEKRLEEFISYGDVPAERLAQQQQLVDAAKAEEARTKQVWQDAVAKSQAALDALNKK